MNEYKDLFFSARTTQNAGEIRSLYVLHAINHLLKYAHLPAMGALLFVSTSRRMHT
jgi:hypothetical protein